MATRFSFRVAPSLGGYSEAELVRFVRDGRAYLSGDTIVPTIAGSAGPVQEAAASIGGVQGSVTVNLGAAPTVGNLLVACIAANGTAAVTGVTCTNCTFTEIATSAVNRRASIWVAIAGASAASAVVGTVVGNKAMNVSEWTGYSIVEDVAEVIANANGANPSMGPITTVSPNDLIMHLLAENTVTASAPTGGFTALTTDIGQVGAHLFPAYLEAAAAGAYSVSWTATSNAWEGLLVALQSPGPPPTRLPASVPLIYQRPNR